MTASTDAAPPFSFGSPTWPGLAKVAEEAGETVQVIGKFLATGGDPNHWDGTDLRLRLTEEIADLQAALGFVCDHNDLDADFIADRVARKRALFETWHAEHSTVLDDHPRVRGVALAADPILRGGIGVLVEDADGVYLRLPRAGEIPERAPVPVARFRQQRTDRLTAAD